MRDISKHDEEVNTEQLNWDDESDNQPNEKEFDDETNN